MRAQILTVSRSPREPGGASGARSRRARAGIGGTVALLLLFVLEPGARADITLEESLNLTGANARCSFDVDVDGVVTDDEKDIEPGDFDDDVVAHVGGADGLVEPPETIVLEVLPGDDYAPSIPSTATITLLSTEKIKSK